MLVVIQTTIKIVQKNPSVEQNWFFQRVKRPSNTCYIRNLGYKNDFINKKTSFGSFI